MKVTRALLLSSEKQAESWERAGGYILFASSAPKVYRYLVTDCGDTASAPLRFEIFRVTQEQDARKQERVRDHVSEVAHVYETFKDVGELINFLRCYQIDFEDGWEPVESKEERSLL